MMTHLPVLTVVIPLIAAFLIVGCEWVNKKLCYPLAVIGLGASMVSSFGLFSEVLKHDVIRYRLGGWPPPWGIAYHIDRLNAFVLVVITLVAFLNLVAVKKSVEKDFPDKSAFFYTLYVLFATGLYGIVITGDAFNLYVLLEIASLTGYALVGMGRRNAPLAALRYIIMGAIGASFYLLGVGYLYIMTGSLNMADIATILPKVYDSNVVLIGFILCLTGLFVKMALFPLHGWLPNAYTEAPPAAVSMIAPLTTKVMIYVMIRIVLSVFSVEFAFNAVDIAPVFVVMAVCAIFMGSILALCQTALKRMFSYIIVAEVGYMVGGFWIGNSDAMTGAILHIVNDTLMTFCVFLSATAIVYRTNGDAFTDIRGLFAKMPFSMIGFVAGGLSIIGVPPTCGFFSKWYLISGGIAAGHWAFVIALIFSSLVNIILFFRIFEICYYDTGHHSTGENGPGMNEAPTGMIVPLMIVSILLIVAGLFTNDIVLHVIRYTLPNG